MSEAGGSRPTSGLHVFTSAAVNYLPKVRMLCGSIRRHHPEATIHLALADLRPDWLDTANEPFDDVMDVSQLGIPNWQPWTFRHSIVELSTAIKPFALKRLLERPDCDRVLYFDPDMVLFSRVDDILDALSASNVTLTPHQSKPETSYEAVIDNEIGSLKWGVFNLGFIGVRDTGEGHRFCQWWADRVYDFCRDDVPNGLFTDQKWINLAPVFFEGVHIVRGARHNVATWNLTTREFGGRIESGFTVDGEPLGFYHFTGFDSGAHRIMAGKNAAGNRSVQELIGWYERETTSSSEDRRASQWPWAFASFSDGSRVEPWHRRIYRDNIDLQYAFPDPYRSTSNGLTFHLWCESEGRIRFAIDRPAGQDVSRSAGGERGPMSLPVALRLFGLLLAPRSGKELRARLVRLLRREGLTGVVRRLRGNAGG